MYIYSIFLSSIISPCTFIQSFFRLSFLHVHLFNLSLIYHFSMYIYSIFLSSIISPCTFIQSFFRLSFLLCTFIQSFFLLSFLHVHLFFLSSIIPPFYIYSFFLSSTFFLVHLFNLSFMINHSSMYIYSIFLSPIIPCTFIHSFFLSSIILPCTFIHSFFHDLSFLHVHLSNLSFTYHSSVYIYSFFHLSFLRVHLFNLSIISFLRVHLFIFSFIFHSSLYIYPIFLSSIVPPCTFIHFTDRYSSQNIAIKYLTPDCMTDSLMNQLTHSLSRSLVSLPSLIQTFITNFPSFPYLIKGVGMSFQFCFHLIQMSVFSARSGTNNNTDFCSFVHCSIIIIFFLIIIIIIIVVIMIGGGREA
ncbi:uncharacterized protein LOC124147998 isoform X1 [Haliotis rufescens]|uniref:uncharacterized protein LOC124147998 isoform X1 n=1 Tax=Haliotis rufescens TaxID=6454 RepID=UPI00201EC790|nr:uncharacterized protein LOC124147998 isoform X1 [Haliotis rufescens]XP_048254343.1 uncharacterized protein LOC124147998 isoform X1 [Haliotis rufescens]XP_048254344.1 uncharacterized protein LOC124147998 isoform X1 [Haliotis rufescens]XP_048254345.1 uncharacterized protein LOC124147998 isoform X1 [Haliotis rufescens]XP_048254347.1 uncharacterized protein LOC124147998 isoform X1 [Haliotis rufescens]XP_048254348.1 uncharacterized protein LOC124147998 isoform X1 [Haliotis rufescens]XP_04825434